MVGGEIGRIGLCVLLNVDLEYEKESVIVITHCPEMVEKVALENQKKPQLALCHLAPAEVLHLLAVIVKGIAKPWVI